jgi:hypothetical protein
VPAGPRSLSHFRQRATLIAWTFRLSGALNPHSPRLIAGVDENTGLRRILSVLFPRRGLQVSLCSFLVAGSLAGCGSRAVTPSTDLTLLAVNQRLPAAATVLLPGAGKRRRRPARSPQPARVVPVLVPVWVPCRIADRHRVDERAVGIP